MAIKAIVNNTEKEIEQIKNSDEQDIDYVYSRIGDTEVEGALPISIKSIGGNLSNYRIYGNTVNGNSVGDKTANLLNIFRTRYQGERIRNCDTSKYIYGTAATVLYIFSQKVRSASINSDGTIEVNSAEGGYGLGFIISANPDTTYTLNFNCDKVIAPDSTYAGLNFFKNDNTLMNEHTGIKNLPYTFTTPSEAAYVYIVFRVAPKYGNAKYSNIMLNEGDIALPYEPYGYKIPITITADSAETTDIYLNTPLAKSGDIADYIDYAAQKRYNADGTESSATLPEIAVAVGTNILAVNTSIQPSNIYIKDSFDYKKVFTATRVIEDGLPLNYKSIKDSDSTLKNYRIYGNTETKTRSYSGAAPLSFPITDGIVSNYRVYGQTSRNLFISRIEQGSYSTIDGQALSSSERVRSYIDDYIYLPVGTYTITATGVTHVVCYSYSDKSLDTYVHKQYLDNWFPLPCTFTNTANAYYKFAFKKSVNNQDQDIDVNNISNIMLNVGSTALPYEPYGESVGNLVTDSQSEHYGEYAIPITNNSETANIYLDEPLTKQGNNADYIDYAEQKRYNADGTSEDVSLPVLPAQSSTNSFSVGTEVQPSNITVDVDELVSVGDKTANLFDMNDYNPDNVTANDDGSFYIRSESIWGFSCEVETGKTYFLSWEELNTYKSGSQLSIAAKAGYHKGYSYPCYTLTFKNSPPDVWYKRYVVFTATDDYLSIDGMSTYIRNIMLVEGSTAMDYEPYGYKIPITITADSAETTDIYLDAPLAKSGNNADYIDYATQKRRNSDGTESSVTLPALPTFAGTNTLSVGTEIEPSNIYIKGKIKSLD